jgi:SAM-dependent methyltransferase
MNEASKIRDRLKAEPIWTRVFDPPGHLASTWRVLDIGCGGDKVLSYADAYDLPQGDAQKLADVPDEMYDLVFSAHCLEHMRDPLEALLNWWRVVKVGGHLFVAIPDEDLYEQRVWPSVYNPDHKWSWSIDKERSHSPAHQNVNSLLKHLSGRHVLFVRTVDTGYDYQRERIDQTMLGAEAAIEFLVRKVPAPMGFDSSVEAPLVCPQCGQMKMWLIGREGMDLVLNCSVCGFGGRAKV